MTQRVAHFAQFAVDRKI